jgi:uncharacterized membrane-anchored protein
VATFDPFLPLAIISSNAVGDQAEREGVCMSLRVFWKSLVFWIAILLLLTVIISVMPGSQKWPRFVPFVIILAIALAQLWYFKRKERPDSGPEA